ncbi:LPXTG cell wall anchor domain-containing protein [Vagococcus jeotgali]|uniref:LPXTG cell wall anchor domain-containing protein n=1 Tax=Vagococcus jeotgali TaxID=3109030 RepID=UPI002DD9BDED|nr:LPXTG cell wall anchor domain-containing protein [Vagococcus sp. B2T-5]
MAAIDEVHTASEVEKVMAKLLFSKVEPGKPGANNNKPGTTTSVNKPATGSTTAGSKGSAAKGSTTGSKDSSKQLPQTGEEVRNGLIAGGLASVLGGAALFFRKPR